MKHTHKHNHGENFGCNHDHNHDDDHEHTKDCGCGHDHSHKHEKEIGVAYYLSPIGFIEVITNFDYVVSIQFVSEQLHKAVETPAVIDAIKQIDEYFNKKRKIFNLKLPLMGTDYQKKVYRALVSIPFGTTLSYGDVGAMIGDPKAGRAVGNANNKNKLLLAIPCHRVTTKSGKLSGTKDWKEKQLWLINHEKTF